MWFLAGFVCGLAVIVVIEIYRDRREERQEQGGDSDEHTV